MLIQPTLDSLNRLKLYGMAAALSEQLTQSAATASPSKSASGCWSTASSSYRDNRRLTRLLQLAQLKQRACLEDIDFRSRRGLDRSQLASLATCDWIRAAQNLDRSWRHRLRQDLSRLRACPSSLPPGPVRALPARARGCSRNSASVTPTAASETPRRHRQGRSRRDRRLRHCARSAARERNDLLELLDDRVGTRSTLITSQLPIEHWHDYIGDPTLADAILDRLLHIAHKIHLEGRIDAKTRRRRRTTKRPPRPRKID